jgi:putative endonuclease
VVVLRDERAKDPEDQGGGSMSSLNRYCCLIPRAKSTMHCAWIYILTNERHTVLYVGVTANISARLWEHATKQNPKSFTARYNVTKLIYYEGFNTIVEAIRREKIVKGKSRRWKEELIASMNPRWESLVGDVNSL